MTVLFRCQLHSTSISKYYMSFYLLFCLFAYRLAGIEIATTSLAVRYLYCRYVMPISLSNCVSKKELCAPQMLSCYQQWNFTFQVQHCIAFCSAYLIMKMNCRRCVLQFLFIHSFLFTLIQALSLQLFMIRVTSFSFLFLFP